MTLKLEAIRDAGEFDRERVVLRAAADCDAGQFVILCALEKDGFPLSGNSTAYWLPDQEVKTGDLVVVYSKFGKKNTKTNQSGNTTYFFYWKQSGAIWLAGKAAALVRSEAYEWVIPTRGGDEDVEPPQNRGSIP